MTLIIILAVLILACFVMFSKSIFDERYDLVVAFFVCEIIFTVAFSVLLGRYVKNNSVERATGIEYVGQAKEAVFQRMYPFANYPEVTTTNINSYFVERAVDDYKKEVI